MSYSINVGHLVDPPFAIAMEDSYCICAQYSPMEILRAQLTIADDKVVRTISILSFFNGEKPLDNVAIETSTTGRRSERVLL